MIFFIQRIQLFANTVIYVSHHKRHKGTKKIYSSCLCAFVVTDVCHSISKM